MKFYREKLDNGLTVLFEKRDVPVVSTSLAVKQGFAFEPIKKKGISHLLEHLVHKGTENRNYKQITQEVEKKGGIINGYTDEEVTNFWTKLPKKHFLTGLDVSSDLVFNPLLKEKDFVKEKMVVLEEIKMHKDNPQRYVLDKIKDLLYKKPFGLSGIGTEKTVRNITIQEMKDFHKKNYKTNQMVLSVVGNTTLKKIKQAVKKFLGTKTRDKKVRPKKINKKVVEKRKGVNQANLVLGVHVPSLARKERYSWDIFDAVFAKGMSSRLFEEIREKRGLAYDVSSFFDRGKNYGYYVIYAGTTKNKVEKCKEIILKEFEKMKNLTRKELKEAKQQLIGLRKVGSEESVNVMNGLVKEELGGDAKEFYKYEKKITDVRLEEVRNLEIKDYSSIALLPE